jgi:hypothetical protein
LEEGERIESLFNNTTMAVSVDLDCNHTRTSTHNKLTRQSQTEEIGWQHAMLKGFKTFHCPNPECRIVMDRDVNGANIMIKLIVECSNW